ncbi:MAG TPA: 30S ribosomal protein S9 [Ktedonobacterales bacterium]|nr:30S ribosomal protein S9 [Ktedonobacterales bacterium]
MAENLGPYFYGTGRRKTAVARVRLHPNGDGRIIVNGREANEYFGREALMMQVRAPMRLLEIGPQFTVSVKVVGGGTSGQAGAIRHGLARALVRLDEANKPAMRKAGFLTRDPRMKERKKYGLKRARKAPQYTKR